MLVSLLWTTRGGPAELAEPMDGISDVVMVRERLEWLRETL